MGVRRHVPAQQLDVHLRPGLPGRAHGPAPELVQGCCSYGAHFTDAEDEARVVAAPTTLTAAQWQFRKEGMQRGVIKTNPPASG